MKLKKFMALPSGDPLDELRPNGGFCGIFRTIGCIGDSLSSGEFESLDEEGNKGYHDEYEYSWGQYLARLTGSKVYNFSGAECRPGNTARALRRQTISGIRISSARRISSPWASMI